MIVRRVRSDEWRVVRDLRLAALEENPLAFVERLAEAQAKPDERWRSRTDAQATSSTDFLAVAETSDGQVVATTAGYVDTVRPGVVSVYYVYVAEAWRGRGLVGALVDAVRAWAEQIEGITALALMVHSENARAIAAYSRLGFRDIGVATQHPLDPRKRERELHLLLARRDVA